MRNKKPQRTRSNTEFKILKITNILRETPFTPWLNKKCTGLLVFFLLISTALFSQPLTLERARESALASSRSLEKYEMAIRSSILDERNQLYSMLPTFSAGYSASANYLRNDEFLNPADNFNFNLNFSVTQIIFQGGRSFIQRSLNKIATESVRIDALSEFFNVLDTVDSAYYTVLEAIATLEAEESSLQTAELSLSIAQIRHESGMINFGDYLRALSDKETRENSRNSARRNLSLQIARLRNLTGIEEINSNSIEQIDFSVYEELLQKFANISDEDADKLFDNLWTVIASSNTTLARAALSSQRARNNLSLTRAEYAPTLRATIFATGGGFGYSAERGTWETPNTGGVTLSGTIPVDFWVMRNRLERSKIARDSAAIDFTNTEISVAMELQTALLRAFEQAGTVLSSRRSMEYTERHSEYVTERYRLLQSSVSDMVEASTLLINSRNNHTRASYGFLQSISRLRTLGAFEDEEALIQTLLDF